MAEVLAGGIADGLVRITALQLSRLVDRSPANGRWRFCIWSGVVEAAISVQDQSGLVDLNTGSAPLMLAMLEGLGLSPAAAVDLSDTMHDYRDLDSVTELGGSEPVTYVGRTYGPKNGPFEAIEELDQLPGVTADFVTQLEPLVTVFNPQLGIDLDTAPDALVKALGVSRTSVSGLAYSGSRLSSAFAILVAVRLADGTRFVRRAMVERTDEVGRPFVILAWTTGAWPDPPVAGGRAQPCPGSAS